VTLDLALKETIQREEKVIELDTIVILRGPNGKQIIGHAVIGKLEDRFLTILKANNVV
jgi:hypothetical protein